MAFVKFLGAKVNKPPWKYIWTPEKDELLRRRYNGKVCGRIAEIATELGWTERAIKERAAQLALCYKHPHPMWTSEELAVLLMHVESKTARWIGEQLGKSVDAVRGKAKRSKAAKGTMERKAA